MLDLLAQVDPNLVLDEAHYGDPPGVKDFKECRIGDREDLWFADELARERFVECHEDLLHVVTAFRVAAPYDLDGMKTAG